MRRLGLLAAFLFFLPTSGLFAPVKGQMAERFLLQFVRRNVKLQVVFFECGRWLWRADPTRLLARSVLVRHLQENVRSPLLTVVTAAGDWTTPQWLDRVAAQPGHVAKDWLPEAA